MIATDVGGVSEMIEPQCQQWLSEPNAVALARHLDAALINSEPEAYQLSAQVPGWQIQLSWQAFHERLPRSQPHQAVQQTHPSRLQRALKMAKRGTKALLHRLQGENR